MPREPGNYVAARYFNTKVNDELRVEYDASNNPIYVGNAPAGTTSDARGWTIKKITYSGNNPIRVQTTDGTGTQTWDLRATYF